MLEKYNPFHLTTEDFVLATKGKQVEQASGCIDRYGDYFLVKTKEEKSGESVIMQIDAQGGVEASFSLHGALTPFLRPSHHQLLLFSPQKKVFHLIDFKDLELTDFELNELQMKEDSDYSLHFFSRASLVCLAEKNKGRESVRLTLFNFCGAEQASLAQVGAFQSEGWRGEELHEVTGRGKVGWCPAFKKQMEVFLCEAGEGVSCCRIDLESLGGFPPDEEFQVMAMWQIDNFLYLVVNPLETPSFPHGYSPIIRVNLTSSNFDPAFVPLSCSELLFRDCLNLEDYVILFSASEAGGNAASYVFDKELELIVKEEQVPVSLKPVKAFRANSYLLVGAGDDVRVAEKAVTRINSLSFQRMLELTEQAVNCKAETAIVILGGDRTGKSTLRHFLAGERLLHRYNELGFNEVVPEVDEMKGLEHEEERGLLPWMNIVGTAAIVDVPDWTHRTDFFKAQVRILLARLFRAFRQLHFLITIPEEYISSSYENEEFFSAVLGLIGDDSVQDFISIVLTKVETAEDSLLTFSEYIEEIIDINSDNGSMIKAISEAGRILVFENREVEQSEGKAMLEKLLSFGKLSLSAEVLSIEQDLRDSLAVDCIFFETEYYIRLLNAFLQVACHKLAPALFPYSQNTLNAHISHNRPKLDPERRLKSAESVGPALVAVLAKLRAVVGKQEKGEESVEELKGRLLKLAEAMAGELEEESFFSTIATAFVATIRNSIQLSLERSIGKEANTYSTFIKILQDEPEGILGQSLKTVVSTLQAIPAVQSCPELQEFSGLLGKALPKVKRVVFVEMSFEEERRQAGRRGRDALEAICGLPANALKLDLICDELLRLCGKENLEARDYKSLCFYLREASRICEYHELFFEAIVLLFVVPDFAGIEKLVEGMAQHLKRSTPYEVKKLLDKRESELVDKLLTLARDCLRDGLVKKLINVWTLSSETASKPAKLREEAQKKAAGYLSNAASITDYVGRLENKSIKHFYNLADEDFKKLLAEKKDLVLKCIAFEEQEASRKTYEETEALRYVIDDLPIPA